MTNPEPSNGAAVGLILGAVFDFVLDCCYRPAPMVIGGGYPRDKFIEQFERWAMDRGLNLSKIEIEQFRECCRRGLLQ